MTKIRRCECKHAYQDMIYGKGKRVMNSCGRGARCTVCGKETSASK